MIKTRTTPKYKGYLLVETGRRYYSACKGADRIAVGSIRHGDWADLVDRFRKRIDEVGQWA